MFEIDSKTQVTDEQIDDLLAGAFEGGSNYWYLIDNETTPYAGYAAEAWRQDDTGILILDNENPDEPGRWLNRDSVKKGLVLMQTKYPSHWADFMTENYDAITSDIFLQLCLFDEVIYG